MLEQEVRISELERALIRFSDYVGREFNKAYNLHIEVEQEMREFKNEMHLFKDEMHEFKNEMSEFKNEMSEFKNEMSEFKNEMSEFKNEMRERTRGLDRKWGELANKMGTLVEDLVAPSMPAVIRERFGAEPDYLGERIRRRLKDGRYREFDAMAMLEHRLFINSTKSKLYPRDVEELEQTIPEVRLFFPEYKDKVIVGILASLHVDPSVVTFASKNGFMVMAVGDSVMQCMNEKDFMPREW